MKVNELITDNAISIAFDNTNFGDRTPREIIKSSLKQVNEGHAIGYTAQCCLVQLGLITQDLPKGKLRVTPIGTKYLEII